MYESKIILIKVNGFKIPGTKWKYPKIKILLFSDLVCSSLDSTIHLWDVATGVKLRPIENGPMECW